MILTNVSIEGYRTIKTSQELEVDSLITVLIGANESGKTNVLQAINSFLIKNDFKEEDISRSEKERYQRKIYPKIGLEFKLEKNENVDLKNMLNSQFDILNLKIEKIGNGIDSYKFYYIVDDKNNMIEERDKLTITISEVDRSIKLFTKTLNEKYKTKADIIALNQEDKNMDQIDKDISELEVNINSLEKEKEDNKLKLINLDETIHNNKKTYKIFDTINENKNKIINMVPSISYHQNIEYLPENIPIQELLQQTTPRSKAVFNLFKIGETDDLNFLNENRTRLGSILRSTSERITEKINILWKQEKINFELRKENDIVYITINEDVSVAASPRERSEGFQWFLSFFASFMIEEDKILKKQIFLLDEPAIHLHPKGQKDFLNMLENISKYNQIVYTSHSPFLINKNYPLRIRLSTKDASKGTMIHNKPYSDGKCKFWEPLKSAIGICLGDLLSLGETNIIVEGISDQIILTGVSTKLASIDEPFLDLEKITVVPAMGSDSAIELGQFAKSQDLKPIILLDNDGAGKKSKERAQKNSDLEVKLVNHYKKEAITIEDLIPLNEYIEAINDFYSNIEGYKKFTVSEENLKEITEKGIIRIINEYFKNLDIEFSKTAVSSKYIENINIIENKDRNYDSFIKLFKEMNRTAK